MGPPSPPKDGGLLIIPKYSKFLRKGTANERLKKK